MNIYVGNLSYDVSEEDLKELFAKYGTVVSVKIISDYGTGRSKGFGFVEMENDDEANAAIEELDGSEFQGRTMKVNPARPKGQGGGGGGGPRHGGGHGGGRGGGRGPR